MSRRPIGADLEAVLGAEDPPRAQVEAALTDGHAVALELEADRVRLQRGLVRARNAHDPRFDAAIAAMSHELQVVTEELRTLLARLAEIAARFGSGARFSDRAG